MCNYTKDIANMLEACIPTKLQGDNIMKGNAVVYQVASFSYLIAPVLVGVLYVMLGLKPVMGISQSL